MTTNPSTFSFQSHHIRTIVSPNQIWFVAKDVCSALGIDWSGNTLKPIPESWQGLRKLLTPSGNQQVRVISEAAVYKLAFRSNKPEADAFTNWVVSEVLPAIRKTGKYEAKAKPKPKALPAPEPRLSEKGAETMARLLRLRADLFQASLDVRNVLMFPFWHGLLPSEIPDHQREFAKAINEATGGLFMAINSNMTAVEQLFRAYVEAENMVRA